MAPMHRNGMTRTHCCFAELLDGICADCGKPARPASFRQGIDWDEDATEPEDAEQQRAEDIGDRQREEG